MQNLFNPDFIALLAFVLTIVFGLVEFAKQWVTGRALTAVSLVIGVVLSVSAYVAQFGAPADFGGWFAAVLGGIMVGLAASGFYDFVNARFPKTPDRVR